MKYITAFLLPLMLSGCVLTEQNTNQGAAAEAIALEHDEFACVVSDELGQEMCETTNEGVVAVIHPAEPIELNLSEETVPAPIEITDTWDRVRKNFTFHVPDKQRVISQRNWYLRHPSYMSRVSKRAEPFLYYITEELEKAGMPAELALLPIVESAFDPFAYSHGRAAGMWQFIPSTGKNYGMKQTWWYDGRRDVIASTAGAIKYLQRLHNMFDGDWLHALAAYNSGEGRVMRAIRNNKRKGRPTDFWALDLPRETRAYVPKLLALADILANKEEYGFAWPSVNNQPVIEIVDVQSQIDLAVAAKKAGLTTKELHALNPGYNRWATDPDGPHRLVVPLQVAEDFVAALAETDKKDRLNWVRHKVKSGESLGLIAKKYNTTIDVIQSINGMNDNVIFTNDFLLVPIALKSMEEYSLSADQRLARKQAEKKGAYQLTHKIENGDTFWDLSRTYKVAVRDLAKWNGMAPRDPLRPGKELVVWVNQVSEKQTDNSIMRTLTYTVRNGDSLSRIASKFNVKVSDITKWNSLKAKRYLQPGQKLKLYVDVTET
ncbi:LysM peptidoglycan-binding domain-containing protein [Brumicola nitratireducens]|uniref:Lytic transglycosylase, catalytic n=1 Tax=Glaciecola nitratireducens (strain JCM 12485 / KCTC 12276 / FR1064) TaxID=1085623 RepID=G4QEQ2_GLANF|nr:LysM peptidoglycan-binding domain-containing protein [Glaciecola nitratireducens]AEP29591.1 lytic transglycosylase, catalytic [Glaciecola nitratireducens FR1064]